MKHTTINKVQVSQDEVRKILLWLKLDTEGVDNNDGILKQSISFRSIEQVFGLTSKVKCINHLIDEELSKQFERTKLGLLEEGVNSLKAGAEEVYIPLSDFIELLLILRKRDSFFDSVWINIQLVKEFIQKNKFVVGVNSDLDILLNIYSEYNEETDTLSYFIDVYFKDLS